MRTCRPRPG